MTDKWNSIILSIRSLLTVGDDVLDELACTKAERDKWIKRAEVEKARADAWANAYEQQYLEVIELRNGAYNRLVARMTAEGMALKDKESLE